MWRRTSVLSTALLVTGLSTAVICVMALPLAGLGIEKRFITPTQLVILSLGLLANHVIALEGFYVMAQRARPLTLASLTGFTCTAIGVWGGGYLYSTTGVVIGFATTIACIALPLHTLAYLKFRQEARA